MKENGSKWAITNMILFATVILGHFLIMIPVLMFNSNDKLYNDKVKRERFESSTYNQVRLAEGSNAKYDHVF
jgi:hypothetical protein